MEKIKTSIMILFLPSITDCVINDIFEKWLLLKM